MSSLVAFTPTHFTIPNVSHVPSENDSSCLHAPGTSDNPATSGTAQPRNIYFNSTLPLPTFPTEPCSLLLTHSQSSSPPSISLHTHSMRTRSQNNIFKPNLIINTTKHPLPSSLEPCVFQVLKDPQWRMAMSEEFIVLVRNGTWELVVRGFFFILKGTRMEVSNSIK